MEENQSVNKKQHRFWPSITAFIILFVIVALGVLSTLLFVRTNLSVTPAERAFLENEARIEVSGDGKRIATVRYQIVQKSHMDREWGGGQVEQYKVEMFTIFGIPTSSHWLRCWTYRPGIDEVDVLDFPTYNTRVGSIFCAAINV